MSSIELPYRRRRGLQRVLEVTALWVLVSGTALAQSPEVESAPPPESQAETEGPPSENQAQTDAETETPSAGSDPAVQGITPPELLRFVEASYPPEAKAEGLTAEVLLSLLVEEDGSVSEVRVLESAGHGFDEAAAEAAKQFRFRPAMRDGDTPVAVRIPFRYSFTLQEQAVEEPAELTTGSLSGRLLAAGAEVPLVGAELQISDGQGQLWTLRSDDQGHFELPELEPGSYSILVSAPGFSPLQSQETVAPGELTELTYRLSMATDGALEVFVEGVRPPREVTRRTITRREMTRIPGTSGDALRSLQSLPGVARPPGLAGLLIVRGSAPQDTATYIDGDQVPLIYHFGGLTSAVPTELLDSIDFYPGNFSSRYGRVMGGIVDVKLREPDTSCRGDYGAETTQDGCLRGMAQVDLLDTRFVLQGPLIEGWTFAAGGRRSWVDAWLGPVLREVGTQVTTAPVYNDYQLILSKKKSEDDRVSFRFFGSNDRLEILVESPAAQDPGVAGGSLRFATGFWRLQSLIEKRLSESVSLQTLASVGHDEVNFRFARFLFQLESTPIQARSEFSWRAATGLTLNAGLDFQVVPNRVRLRLPEPPRPGESSPGPFTTRRLLQTSNRDTFFRPAWYADAEWKPTAAVTVVPGFRVDFARDTGQADFSPRLSSRWDLTKNGEQQDGTRTRRTTLKGGIGLFHQPAQPQETNEVFGTPGLETNRALHVSFGVERELTDQLELSLEGFYKDLTHLVSREPGLSGNFEYNNRGTGNVIGLETLLKYKPDDHFFGWLAYTLSRSVRRENPDEPERPFQFDQTHILTLLGSYRLGNGWEAGARLRLVSGPLDTPVRSFPELQALYAADAATYVPLQGEPFSERLPLFHQVDLRVEKNWDFEDFQLRFYLDVLNSYNNAASEALLYNFDFSRRSYQQGLPLLPSLGLRGEF